MEILDYKTIREIYFEKAIKVENAIRQLIPYIYFDYYSSGAIWEIDGFLRNHEDFRGMDIQEITK